MKKPRILISTGDGKGKSTSALGMVLRHAGHGMHVFMLQFMKNNSDTGEIKALQQFPTVTIKQHGLGFVPKPTSSKFHLHQEKASEALKIAQDAIKSQNYDLIVLDEICGAISLGLLKEEAVIELIESISSEITLVLTGRNATENLIELADTVTEMKMIKHGYQENIPAQKGIEF